MKIRFVFIHCFRPHQSFVKGRPADSSNADTSCDSNCEVSSSLLVEMEKKDEILKIDER